MPDENIIQLRWAMEITLTDGKQKHIDWSYWDNYRLWPMIRRAEGARDMFNLLYSSKVGWRAHDNGDVLREGRCYTDEDNEHIYIKVFCLQGNHIEITADSQLSVGTFTDYAALTGYRWNRPHELSCLRVVETGRVFNDWWITGASLHVTWGEEFHVLDDDVTMKEDTLIQFVTKESHHESKH